MKRAQRQARRFQAIDRKTRARQLQRWRREREPEALRSRRLAFLRELCGHIDAGFTPAELRDAQVALSVRDPRQQQLDLKADAHART